MNKNEIKRELYLNKLEEFKDTDFIKVFLGIRRSGKTSLLHSWIDNLKNKGINPENIVFISLESSKYNSITNHEDLDKIVFEKTKNVTGKIYLFFDEIQQVDQWEKAINGYRVDLDCDIYISGSNSELLSGELATHLSGRYIIIDVYPFSFKEILKYKHEIEGIELTQQSIRTIFEEYIKYGGMPSILPLKNDEFIKSALIDIYNSILLKEVLLRYNINDIDLFRRYSNYMTDSIGQTYSSTKIKNYLKSNNVYTTQNTLLKYNDYLQQAYFISKCSRYDIKGKKALKFYEKYYLTDHGFHHALIENNSSRITRTIENIVYIELLRRGYTVNVGKLDEKDDTNNSKEIDFVCEKSGKYVYIQVSYILSTEKTIEREFSPFFRIPDKYDTYVISADTFDLSQKGVKHLNIIDFLLGDEI